MRPSGCSSELRIPWGCTHSRSGPATKTATAFSRTWFGKLARARSRRSWAPNIGKTCRIGAKFHFFLQQPPPSLSVPPELTTKVAKMRGSSQYLMVADTPNSATNPATNKAEREIPPAFRCRNKGAETNAPTNQFTTRDGDQALRTHFY